MKDDSTDPAEKFERPQGQDEPNVLSEDHPFAILAGHDLALVKAMGDALRVLQANSTDQGLKDSIGEAASGRLSFTELLSDSKFSEAFTIPADSCRETIEERREEMSEAERESLTAVVHTHVDRLTRRQELEREVRKAFGGLAG